MNISNYTFPVVERALAVHNGQRDDAHFLQPETHLSGPYKALVREDTNELISVVKDTYKLVRNEELIRELLSSLVGIGTVWAINKCDRLQRNTLAVLEGFEVLYFECSNHNLFFVCVKAVNFFVE